MRDRRTRLFQRRRGVFPLGTHAGQIIVARRRGLIEYFVTSRSVDTYRRGARQERCTGRFVEEPPQQWRGPSSRSPNLVFTRLRPSAIGDAGAREVDYRVEAADATHVLLVEQTTQRDPSNRVTRLSRRVRTHEADHVVVTFDQCRHDCRTDEARRSCYADAHVSSHSSLISAASWSGTAR